jgi:hypothetical protein
MNEYDRVFTAYVADLLEAKQAAEKWWESLMATESQRCGSMDAAVQVVRPRWPLKAVSHPYIIAVYRKYYLEIEQITGNILKKWNFKKSQATAPENAGWGVEDEDEGEAEDIYQPIQILWDDLQRQNPDLAEFLEPLLLVEPIGMDFGAPPDWNELAATRPPVSEFLAHSVEKGVRRLSSAPRDLPEAWSRPEEPMAKYKAGTAHVNLFNEYRRNLKKSVNEAVYSWIKLIRSIQEDQHLSEKEAVNSAYNRALAGPAGSRYIIWVLRKYWLECEALNQTLPREQWVPPEVFLLNWLLDGAYEEEVAVLSQLPFWPIGLDKDGRWV